MESDELATTHEHFFFAILRTHALQLQPIVGNDHVAGLAALEILKRNINTTLRQLWRQNQETSRVYCAEVFDDIFAPVRSKFIQGDGLLTKGALKAWYTAVDDKIAEYHTKAKGPRKYDYLWDAITTQFIPEVISYSEHHPDSEHLHMSDVLLATTELKGRTEQQVMTFRTTQDAILQKVQRNGAIYTSFVGSDWAAFLRGDSVSSLRKLEGVALIWQKRCYQRWLEFHMNDVGIQAVLDTTRSSLSAEEQWNSTFQANRNAQIRSAMHLEDDLRTQASKLMSSMSTDSEKAKYAVVTQKRDTPFAKTVQRLFQRFTKN